MKYWKFKSKKRYQFFVLANRVLLFGTYSKGKVDQFISTITNSKQIPKELKGTKLDYIRSIERGINNKTITITLNRNSTEILTFDNKIDRDIIFEALATQLKNYERVELNLKNRYKKTFIYNLIIILIFSLFFWQYSNLLMARTYHYHTPYIKMFYELTRKYLVNFGEPGITFITIAFVVYQIIKLRRHSILDYKVERISRN